MGTTQENTKQAFVAAVEAALELGDLEKVEELVSGVEALPTGRSSQFLQAQVSRFRAHLAGRRGDDEEADRRFKRATGLFRELGLVFYLALTELEHAEWLALQERAEDAESLIAESREILERLGATPWLERADAVIVPAARIAAGTD
jgi:hypothetical protein